ncbi:hypothetical protein [Streptomyces sp. NPDC059564]|uniref:hypothetical protein n=1 Tax=Streptomyces sp. NPDC059564 TaxID=3346865 RepID=UPI0036A847CF
MNEFPTSGSDFARTLARRSMILVRAVGRAAGEGLHHLTVVQATLDGVAEAQCIITGPVPNEDDANDPLVHVAYMLAGTAMGVSAMLAARTLDPQGEVRFMSWMVRDLVAYPATAEQSVMAYCISEDRDLTDPLPGVTFVDAPVLA